MNDAEQAKERYLASIEHLPAAITPIYVTPTVNAPVELYDGAVTLRKNGVKYTGTGSVRIAWVPSPRIRFDAKLDTQFVDLMGDVTVEFTDKWGGELINADVTGSSLNFQGRPLPVSGGISQWKYRFGEQIEKIIFHVPNFVGFRGELFRHDGGVTAGRSQMRFGEWDVVLQSIPDAPRAGDLKDPAGFGLTHVGRLERADAEPFCFRDAEEALNGLYWMLAFCNGRKTGPLMSIGLHGDEQVSHHWICGTVTAFRDVRGWFPEHELGTLSELCRGFAAKWESETWREVIKSAIYWFSLANAPGTAIENGIVAAHIAFEAVGWTLLTEDLRALSEKGYRQLDAHDKLRLLLNAFHIPFDIPASLTHLLAAAKKFNWDNGPVAIAAIRNCHVHSSPKNRETLRRATIDAEVEAWVLCLHYLELILLALCNYSGLYESRLTTDGYKGANLQAVPWAPPKTE